MLVLLIANEELAVAAWSDFKISFIFSSKGEGVPDSP
jgi:hypothetical protein